jgi:hypothetical protein
MGIGSDALEFLATLKRQGLIPPEPAVIEIGAQQLNNDFLRAGSQIEALGRLFNARGPFVLPNPPAARGVQGEPEHLDASAPRARDFWTWLGFAYVSIDIDGTPGSIALDLNFDDAPLELRQKFHLVTNFGTTEHVANQLNAFKIIHDLTAVGGIMLHNVPAQGMADHGLVNYNPKFFWYLARSNGYRLIHADLSASSQSHRLSDRVINKLKCFGDIPEAVQNYTMADAAIRAIMQKVVDAPFTPPLDVADGATTDLPRLRERYWPVFDRDAFDAFRDKAKPWWKRMALRVARPAARMLRAIRRGILNLG